MEAVSQLRVYIPRWLSLCQVDRTNLTSTKANTLLQLPALYVSFPFQDPIQDAAINSVSVSPWSPAAMVTRFPSFLPTLMSIGQMSYESVSFDVCLMLVSWADWGCEYWEADNGRKYVPMAACWSKAAELREIHQSLLPLISWLKWSHFTTVSLVSALDCFMLCSLEWDHCATTRRPHLSSKASEGWERWSSLGKYLPQKHENLAHSPSTHIKTGCGDMHTQFQQWWWAQG